MKKFTKFILFISLFIFAGCDNFMNTPIKKVELFFNKYQSLDSDVMIQFDNVLDKDYNYPDDIIKLYRKVMIRQYKNLTYEIKDEKKDGNTSYVTVLIEVYDYAKALSEAEEYLLDNPDEFLNEDKSVNTLKYTRYKLEKMNNMKDKIQYTLELKVSKNSDTWMMEDINEIDRKKIHGIYSN